VSDDVRGLAVHAAARVMALAGPSEVRVSSVARALAEGSGLLFRDAGRHELKGFSAPMELVTLE
jgi:class 3 adenylate cyclase